MANKYFLFVLLSALPLIGISQDDSTASKPKAPEIAPYHRNVIKFNPTPMLVMGDVRNLTFSYERILNKDQSVSLLAGYLLFPRLVDDTLLNIVAFTDRSKKGVNLAFEYRYYPLARNRRPAPDGVYIGGYVSYYGFTFKNNFDILKINVDKGGHMEGDIHMFNMGIQLGYQFVFWKRLTLDLLLFGPSYTYRSTTFTIGGELDQAELDDLTGDLAQKIVDRFPVLKEIFSEEKLVRTGKKSDFGFGFRYVLQIGFHF